MGRAVSLREVYDGQALQQLSTASKHANQSRRLLALAEIYDGGKRCDAARIGGVTLQIIRDWVLRFNTEGPTGLIEKARSGAPSKLDDEQRKALAAIVEQGPIPAIHGVVRWRRKDLARWIYEEYGISLEESSVGRELRALGFAKLSARPAIEGRTSLRWMSLKNFPAELAEVRRKLPKGAPIEVWWQDEARVGQKTKITRRWAKRGTRPVAPKDQRTKSVYIFGAICPARGVGAGLVLPYCNRQAMQWHLEEISGQVADGAHAILILDQAGWHTTQNLDVPDNITLLPLPPRSPELNPVENIWQFMRENWLSNRIFSSYEEILAICCEAWNKLVDQPWIIMSIGLREWANRF